MKMKKQIRREIQIDAPAERTWEVLADFGNVHAWAPGVTHSYSTSEVPAGAGASRHCDIQGFGSVEEDIEDWQEGRSFRYRATALGPIGVSTSYWEVRPEGDGRSRVTTTFDFPVRFGPLGAVMMLMMRRKLNKGFDSTMQGLKSHAEKGRAVAA